MKHGTIAAIVCLAVGSSACSFALPVPPSEPSQRTRTAAKTCSNVPGRWFYPINDTLGAAVGGINMAIASSVKPGEEVRYYGLEVDSSTAFWALGVVPLVVFGAGSIYGFIQCTRCDTLLREHHLDPVGRRAEPMEVDEADEAVAAVEAVDEREERWSNPGDGSVGAVVQKHGDEDRAVLPEWSAFRREPLDGAQGQPKKAFSPRTPMGAQP